MRGRFISRGRSHAVRSGTKIHAATAPTRDSSPPTPASRGWATLSPAGGEDRLDAAVNMAAPAGCAGCTAPTGGGGGPRRAAPHQQPHRFASCPAPRSTARRARLSTASRAAGGGWRRAASKCAACCPAPRTRASREPAPRSSRSRSRALLLADRLSRRRGVAAAGISAVLDEPLGGRVEPSRRSCSECTRRRRARCCRAPAGTSLASFGPVSPLSSVDVSGPRLLAAHRGCACWSSLCRSPWSRNCLRAPGPLFLRRSRRRPLPPVESDATGRGGRQAQGEARLIFPARRPPRAPRPGAARYVRHKYVIKNPARCTAPLAA